MKREKPGHIYWSVFDISGCVVEKKERQTKMFESSSPLGLQEESDN